MKTRERILVTSLRMFNEEGESNVSTNHIADEMDISPGNLYYHFRNKEEIILELFHDFKREIEELLLAAESRSMDMEDTWLFLHLVFECIWRYRFFYRNLVDLTQRNRSLRIQFNHILREKVDVARSLCLNLREAGAMDVEDEEIEALAANVAVIATYWLNFAVIRNSGSEQLTELGPAVYQVMSLLVPYLVEPERSHLRSLARQYLH